MQQPPQREQPTSYGQYYQPPIYQAPMPPQPARSKAWLWVLLAIIGALLLAGMLCCAFALGATGVQYHYEHSTPTPSNYTPKNSYSVVQVQRQLHSAYASNGDD